MEIQMLCQNSNTGTVYDISTLAGNIQYTTTLSDQPGKLTFLLQRDPNGIFQISVGSIISLSIDGKGVFFGYAFILGVDATESYKVTAYDQMRYLKNEETMLTENMTADEIFTYVCNLVELRNRVVTKSSWIIPEHFHDKKTLYEIIKNGIMHADINDKKQYFIKDDFGTLLFTELGQYKTDLIIGDASILSSYQYEISIDKDSYNTIKVIRDNEGTGKRDVWIEYDSNNQKRWGKLQYLVKADKEKSEEQIRKLAADLLKLKNKETRTMKLSAIGMRELTAGSGFMLDIGYLGIRQYMWITNATHNYAPEYHTMSLEVFI